MAEYHGWASIWEAYDREEDDERFEQIWQDLQVRVEEENNINKAVGLLRQNSTLKLWCAGDRNHMRGDAEATIELFRYIAEIAPGSYGLLYIWIDDDDDDPEFPAKEYVVYVLRKGTLTRAKDPFLSPTVPTIVEDYEVL